MSRRRTGSTPTVAAVAIDDMPVSARVAWTYLACVAAVLVTGLLAVVANATVAPVLCGPARGDGFADCKLAWLLWVGIIGFAACLLPAVLALKLGAWVWAAALAGFAFLLTAGAVDQWWWWALAAPVPAAAALVSARWGGRARLWLVQRAGIAVLDLAAIAALVWWYRSA